MNDRLWADAEAHMRRHVNQRRRRPHHWWLKTEAGRHQRELLQRLGWWEQ